MRRWFLVDEKALIAPIFLGLAPCEAAIRHARHVTFTIHPGGRLISATDRVRAAWTARAEGKV